MCNQKQHNLKIVSDCVGLGGDSGHRPITLGRKLFLCSELLVLMDQSLLEMFKSTVRGVGCHPASPASQTAVCLSGSP